MEANGVERALHIDVSIVGAEESDTSRVNLRYVAVDGGHPRLEPTQKIPDVVTVEAERSEFRFFQLRGNELQLILRLDVGKVARRDVQFHTALARSFASEPEKHHHVFELCNLFEILGRGRVE